MKAISMLDCTLRDGGRVIDCEFSDEVIEKISSNLAKSNIDIIELGFIRDKRAYFGNTTFFTNMEQLLPFISRENPDVKYVVFVDFGMFDESIITPRMKNGVDGIRFGFTKKNYLEHKDEMTRQILSLKKKGYDIYLQDVNTNGYSDAEILDLISYVNEINPISFGIVDTYGSMDLDDVEHVFNIVNHNLNREIAIDFHSHNNMQLSFALAQRMIKLCRDSRKLIVDATLNGMGKCAGNLNTELIVSYLNRKMHGDYDMDRLLDIIDEYLYDIKAEYEWGYSIPAFMAGIYKAHPNNVIYLTQKFRLKTKDIRHLIARIDEETRQSYNYDNIENLYIEYSNHNVNDVENIQFLREQWKKREILILVPGRSIKEEKNKILKYIEDNNPIVVTVNFNGLDYGATYEFFGNIRRYEKCKANINAKRIVTSNVTDVQKKDIYVNYFDLIESKGRYFDNSTIMLLNLMNRLGIKNVSIAGFDGFSNQGNDYIDSSFYEKRFSDDYMKNNKDMEQVLREFFNHKNKEMEVKFITESIFSKIFEKK